MWRSFKGQVNFFKWEPLFFIADLERAENFTSEYDLDNDLQFNVKVVSK